MQKFNRNQLCPCGSGKKYKKCCYLSALALTKTPPSNSTKIVKNQKRQNHERQLDVDRLSKFTQEDLRSLVGESIYRNFEDLCNDVDIEIYLISENDQLIFLVEGESYNIFSDYEFSFSLYLDERGLICIDQRRTEKSFIALCFLYSILTESSFDDIDEKTIAFTLRSLFIPQDKDLIKFEYLTLVHRDLELSEYQKENSTRSISHFHYMEICPGPYRQKEELYYKLEQTSDLRNLYCCFSDGQAIPMQIFLSHPYRLLEPGLAESMQQILMDRKFNALHENYRWEDNGSVVSYYFVEHDSRLLFKCLEKFIPQIPTFWGAVVDGQLLTKKDWPIRSLNLLRSNNKIKIKQLEAQGRDGDLKIELINKSEKQKFPIRFKNIGYDPVEASVHLTPSDSTIETLYALLRTNFQFQAVEANSSTLTLNNHPDVQLLQSELKRKYSDIDFKSLAEIKSISSQLHFDFNSTEKNTLKVSLSCVANGSTFYLKDDQDDSYNILKSLTLGICSLHGRSARELATRTPLYRNNELKLYKHTGLVKLILLECVQYARQDQKKTEAQFINELSIKLASFLTFLLTKESAPQDTTLKDFKSVLFSQRFIKNLIAYIKSVLKLFSRSETLIHHGSIYQVQIGLSFVNLIEFLVLSELGSEINSKSFFKSKGDYIQIGTPFSNLKFVSDLSDQNKDLFHLNFQKNISISEALAFAHINIDGRPIEQIGGADLSSELNLSQAGPINWFELHPKYFFRGEEIPFPFATRLLKGEVIEYQGRFFRVDPKQFPSIKKLNRFWALLQAKNSSSNHIGFKDRLSVKVERSQILELLALKRAGVRVIGDDHWREISRTFDGLDELQAEHSNQLKQAMINFSGQLKSFQWDGLHWLYNIYRLGLGGILSDDMGLGKTVQSIALLHCLMQRNELSLSLVIAPTSLIYNWKSEFEKFSPDLRVDVFESSTKEILAQSWSDETPRVVLCTYGLLTENLDFFNKFSWQMAFLDEAQSVKNIQAKRRQACYSLKARNKFALTGTPLENHFGEFFSIVDLCLPGALGPYKEFMQAFDMKNVSQQGCHIDGEDLDFLKAKVKPLVLRRTKAVVLKDLPEITETVVPIQFDKKQEKVYKEIALSWNHQIQKVINEKGESGAQLQMLTALLRLRQICSCPQSVPGVDSKVVSPKVSLVVEKLDELSQNGESSIVFTNFLSTLEFLKERLEARNIKVLSISGKSSKVQRERILREFDQSEQAIVLIMTLKTGGVGLNLTKANYVFHLEPWWNPAAENQGTDRVYRIGQSRSVQVYRYIIKNSVEEKMQTLKLRKQKAFDSIFTEDVEDSTQDIKFSSSKLSKNDFDILLG